MTLCEGHDDVSATFIRMPNELKHMFAEKLGIHDVNSLARTGRAINELLDHFIYRRAKDERTKGGRPYFLVAVDDGNLVAVKRFVEAGAELTVTDTVTHLPETAMHSCAYFGHVEIAELLIGKGINVSAVDRAGNAALHKVVMGMHPKEAMVTLLVEAGADVDAPSGSHTPLHLAAWVEDYRVVQRLLDLGADPNAADFDGRRPVHWAASFSSAATVRCLLEAEKNVETVDDEGRTPLHSAVQCGNAGGVIALLEMGADVSSADLTGTTPLQLALLTHGNEASVHRILHLAASTVDRFRELYADCVPSCQLNEPNHMVIEMLLSAGADITRVNNNDASPLTWATARAHTTSFPRAQETSTALFVS